MVLKSKRISYGLIEIKDASTYGWYALYISGNFIKQSVDLNYIHNQYVKY